MKLRAFAFLRFWLTSNTSHAWPVVCLLFILVGCAQTETVTNRLAKASSPYLREHADNPVDWYEWGDEALEKAQREGKPLLISIGYASCHWCHVMEEETFMDTAVARVMNEHFVSIKIDREERPDIDQIYIDAAQLISGNAGWPLNAFALPDGRAFYVATYFPKKQWLSLLNQITHTYADDERNLRKQASAIAKGMHVQDQFTADENATEASPFDYNKQLAGWYPMIDSTHGGLRGAPKFPMPVVWDALLQHHHLTGDKRSLAFVTTTLDELRASGVYDHLVGGFARYATDSLWQIPHFEKMLYDNAQLVSLYSKAFQVTQNPTYEKVVSETLAFVKTEMTSPEGEFYSSINADSEGEEGTFYVWTAGEINEALSEAEAASITSHFNITKEGNWENGKNVLFTKDLAALNNAGKPLEDAKRKLVAVRNQRVRPTTDEKVLTSWNALMIIGYVDAYTAFQREEYLEAAVRCARLLDQNIAESGQVWRVKKEGLPPIEGFLDDYALLASSFITLYQATFDIRWLNRARLITDYAVLNFQDNNSGLFFYSLDKSARQIASKIETADHVIPSSNSVMAENLFFLSEYDQQESDRHIFDRMLQSISTRVAEGGPYYANWIRLMSLPGLARYEVAVVGADAREKSRALMKNYLPNVILMGGNEENLPLLENKKVSGKTLIYVCRNRTCQRPVENVTEALQQMR